MTTPATIYAFDATLHPQPADADAGEAFTDAWGTWSTLRVPRESLATPLAVGFDAALDRLGALPRLYVEPDGSFVWTSPHDSDVWWQVDGNAFDRAGRVQLVDMKGSCPPREFDLLLEAFGWPGQPVMLQLVRSGVFLDEATFRRHAAARGAVGDGRTLRPP
ncbi:MAG: hypothetical protein ACKOC8_11245 [Pirellulales bacterium]